MTETLLFKLIKAIQRRNKFWKNEKIFFDNDL